MAGRNDNGIVKTLTWQIAQTLNEAKLQVSLGHGYESQADAVG